MESLIQLGRGKPPDAIDGLRAAAAIEESLPFDPGPPTIEKPSYELLGEVLLETGDAKDARVAFEKSLARTPDRTASLAGLMQAAEQIGDRTKAAELRAKLNEIWHLANQH
jgi:cytochrome c-type biogenesis protein CcmH/NrfG